jgi:hypothetical protein
MKLMKPTALLVTALLGGVLFGAACATHNQPPAAVAPPPPVATVIPAAPPPAPALAGPASLYPDKSRTPGAVNAAITQATIGQTICNPSWSTRTVRPPASYTTALKKKQMADWGLPGAPSDYEEDHFISLELGGNPTDPKNLWPEPYSPAPGAKQKDTVENGLHKEVCNGTVSLSRAQEIISTDWYACYLEIQKGSACK